MVISIASDHAGVELKDEVIKHIKEQNYAVKDFGTNSAESVDYPEYAHKLAVDVQERKGRGILICGTGNGMSIAANKHHLIRCALCWNVEIAKLARQHNDANIIALPARFISTKEAIEVIETFLTTKFDGGRHKTRIDKIDII